MILEIIKFPNPILKKKAKAIKRVTPEIKKLMDDMLETMRSAPGVGLAGPQVGVSLRIIVVELSLPEKELITLQLANPKIIKKSGKQTMIEGCLSLPGIEAPVERASKVTLKALDRLGKPISITAEGLLATILQHEIDHLGGALFIDRVKDPSLIRQVLSPSEKAGI